MQLINGKDHFQITMNEGLLSDILINSKKDPKLLSHLRRYIEDATKFNTPHGLTRKMIEGMRDIVSNCTAWERPDSESLGVLLDTLYYLVRLNKDESMLIKCGFEMWNLLLKLLSGIERTDKFQILFCKLLSSISLICLSNKSTWRQVVRPLLNVFNNKKLDYSCLEKSLKEFKKISKCGDENEMSNFTRQNIHLLQRFSMVARQVGDFLAQMDILELVFLYVADNRSLMKGFFASGNQEISDMLEKLNFGNFEKDSRLFLNTLNKSLGREKRIFSINCNLIYFGSVILTAASGMDGIWVDVNRDSKRISISCADFLTNVESQCIFLHLPLNEVGNLKLEYGKISGEYCHCITITIDKLTEMYRFTKGRTVICTALSVKNTIEEIRGFVNAAEELSGEIQDNDKENFPVSQDSHRFSCTSPMLLSIGENAELQGKFNQLLSTPQLSQSLCKTGKSHIRTYSSLKDKKKEAEPDRNPVTSGNLQVYQISSSSLGTRKRSLNCSLNSSRSSCISLNKGRMDESFGLLRSAENINEKSYKRETRVHEDPKSDYDLGAEDGREQRLRNYSRQIYEEWASSCEDFIQTQEFPMPDKNPSENNNIPEGKREKRHIPTWEGTEKKPSKKVRQTDWLARNKQLTGRWKSEEITYTSLLDPNGYSYRRWKMETSSERGKFWLNKLKETKKSTAKETDVFIFTDDELTDDSSVFRKDKKAPSKMVKNKKKSDMNLRGNNGTVRNGVRRASIPKNSPKSTRLTKRRRKTTDQPAEIPQEEKEDEEIFSSKGKVSPVSVCSAKSGQFESVIIHSRSDDEEEPLKEGSVSGKRSCYGGKTRIIWEKEHDIFNKTSEENTIGNIAKDIEAKVSECIDQYLRVMHKRELESVSDLLTSIENQVSRLAGNMQDSDERQFRFEKCVEFFREGCSYIAQHENYREKLEHVKEELKALTEDSGVAERKINRFIDRLKDVIMRESELIVEKQLKSVKLMYMERYLANMK